MELISPRARAAGFLAVGLSIGIIGLVASPRAAARGPERPERRPGATPARPTAVVAGDLPTARAVGVDGDGSVAPTSLRVMLDPGHGGSNAGAPSLRRGLDEKHLTLTLAFALRRELRRRGVEVLMTRERDEYVSLRERVRRANHAGVDRFVSLHANATENHAQRGFETWILTPRALDVDARALRQGPGDGAQRAVDPELAGLLDDLERGAALPAAAELAARIQRSLASVRGSSTDRGIRQGAQDVLLGATMPAVLVEIGFIDHPVEGEELVTHDVRAALVTALADAISAD